MGLFKKKESAGCRAWHYEGIPGFAQDMPCEIDIQDDKVVFKQNDSVVNLPISKIQSCEFVKETQYMGKYHNNPVDTCKVKGGAIYCGSSANCQIASSTFTGNTAHSFGGAIYSESMCVSDCSMTDNSSVDAGGGAIYSLKNLEVINSCIYGNLPYDLFAGESVILDYADIEDTYKDTDYDVKKWYKDSGTLFDAETDQPTYCLKFGYKDPTPPQEPETPSEPEQPSEPQVIYKTEYVYVPYTVTKTKEVEKEVIVEKVVGGVTATIGAASLKDAKMDSAIIPGYIEYVQRFVQPTSTMTRGEFANILYGLLTEESRNKIAAGAKDCFTDMADSPYKNVVNTDVIEVGEIGITLPDE